jgi:DnaJ domain
MSNLNSDDYYKILGVGRSATEAELKKAYRKLSIKVGRKCTGGRALQTTLAVYTISVPGLHDRRPDPKRSGRVGNE